MSLAERPNPHIYAFVGPEGSGKSSHAGILAAELGLPCVSTGDMIRALAANDFGPLGDACRKMFAQKEYLPADLLLQIVKERLRQPDAEQGIVLDGGFRTVEETRQFSHILERTGREFSIQVFYLRIPGWEAYARRMRIASRTSETVRREDDTPEHILKRLGNFYSALGTRMSFIREHWGLVIIDARGPKEQVTEEIRNSLKR